MRGFQWFDGKVATNAIGEKSHRRREIGREVKLKPGKANLGLNVAGCADLFLFIHICIPQIVGRVLQRFTIHLDARAVSSTHSPAAYYI